MQQITIPSEFRDAWFASDFGAKIQAKFSQRDQVVEIDFSKCAWIDPIPMLALLCHVKRWAASVDTPDLTINLGNAAVRGVQEDISRARLFVVEHGFHKAFVDACKKAVFKYESGLEGVPIEFSDDSVENLADAVRRTSSVTLYYAPQAAFPPMAIQSPYDGTKVSEFVDSMVQVVDDNLFRARRSEFPHRDSALVRLRQIATEIVGNACEHAYPDNVPGPVYAYARLRHHNDHIRIQPITKKETDVETKADAPLIQHIHDVTGDRYLEFFVCDIGKGLVSDAKDWQANTSDAQIRAELDMQTRGSPKFPLRKLLSMVFRLPISRHKRNVETQTVFRSNVTGLAHVNTVLSQHSDRSRIFVSPEWTAGEHPRPPNYNGGPSDAYFSVAEPSGIAPTGSYFHFAIDVTTSELPLDSYWLKPSDDKDTFANSEFFKLRDSFKPSATALVSPVFDLRQLLQKTLEQNPATDSEVERNWAQYLVSRGPTSVVRMSRDFRKNLTDRIIRQWSDSVSCDPSATLVFCDLSQAQAILFKDHLVKITPPRPSHPNNAMPLASILVIAENLVACSLELYQSEETNNWCFKVKATPPVAAEVVPTLASVRSHDSVAFWSRVSSLCSKVQLLIKDVQWSDRSPESEGIQLPVYLDYSLAVQDRELAKIVRRSLRRALSAFPELDVYSVDELIKPDLDDALRWTRREPVDTHSKSLFVISSIVTGSTITHAKRHRGNPVAVLGCFFVETCPPANYPSMYFAALDWKPLPNFSLLPTETRWERIPGTPYVRPFSESFDNDHKLRRISLVRQIPRNLVGGKQGQNALPSVTQAYAEWHRDNLLRVGHWSVDRRHGLIEIDHTRALQISAESRQGFYSWLSEQLQKRASKTSTPLLVYPASRLNAIMIRHLLKIPAFNAKNWHVLPINYLPDVGDGLRQISPLTTEQVRTTDAARSGGVAVFVDIGFVGNRTFRHTARQLRVLGIKQVTGMGLVNRTSYPALSEEMAKEDVVCYWRIDIPTLNDERSCPVCKGLHTLLTLRERAITFQPALVPCINDIRSLWALNEPSLSWWDHGLDPIVLPHDKEFAKKFGFTRPERHPTAPPTFDENDVQSMLFSNDGEAIGLTDTEPGLWPSDKVIWNKVYLRTGTQAAAYGIEIARTQASPDYPWRLAQQIAEAVKNKAPVDRVVDTVKSGAAVAVEIVACHLLLCGGDLTVASREQGANLLLRYLVELEAELANESHSIATEQLRRLRGLAALAFANLDSRTKRLLLENVVEALSSVQIVNQETCIALMAIVSTGEHDESHGATLPSSFERLANDRLVVLNASKTTLDKHAAKKLIWNFRQITVSERNLVDQFEDALRFFGTADHHGQYAVVKKDVEVAQSNNQDGSSGVVDINAGWALLRSAFLQAHSLICQGWQSISNTGEPGKVGGELFRALCNLETDSIDQVLRYSHMAKPEQRSETQKLAFAAMERIRIAFHRSLIRLDPLTLDEQHPELLRIEIDDLLEVQTTERNPAELIQVIFNFNQYEPPGVMRYILLGAELRQMVRKLKEESLQHGNKTPVVAPESFDIHDGRVARLWVNLHGGCDGSLRLSFWNQGTKESQVSDFENGAKNLAPIHQKLGTKISREVPSDTNGSKWFVTHISLKWIAGGNV